MKRLFLFAGYDPHGVVRDSLTYYLRALSRCGDVVLVMDSDVGPEELSKTAPYVVHAAAERHREYDFGSYKRAWQWAKENLGIEEYGCIYMVNDSVIGPLYDIEPYLARMDASGCDAFGMVLNPHRTEMHLQSWFIGAMPAVFRSEMFDRFMTSVRRLASKEEVCIRYEHGFTEMLAGCGFSYCGLFDVKGKGIYNNVKLLYIKGMPFFKKSAFTRHNGSLGAQVKYVLEHSDPQLAAAVEEELETLYGGKNLLTSSRWEICRRYTSYLLGKLWKPL